MPLVLRGNVHCGLLTVLHYNDYRLLEFEEVLFWLLFLAFLHALPNNLRGMASGLHTCASHLYLCFLSLLSGAVAGSSQVASSLWG